MLYATVAHWPFANLVLTDDAWVVSLSMSLPDEEAFLKIQREHERFQPGKESTFHGISPLVALIGEAQALRGYRKDNVRLMSLSRTAPDLTSSATLANRELRSVIGDEMVFAELTASQMVTIHEDFQEMYMTPRGALRPKKEIDFRSWREAEAAGIETEFLDWIATPLAASFRLVSMYTGAVTEYVTTLGPDKYLLDIRGDDTPDIAEKYGLEKLRHWLAPLAKKIGKKYPSGGSFRSLPVPAKEALALLEDKMTSLQTSYDPASFRHGIGFPVHAFFRRETVRR